MINKTNEYINQKQLDCILDELSNVKVEKDFQEVLSKMNITDNCSIQEKTDNLLQELNDKTLEKKLRNDINESPVIGKMLIDVINILNTDRNEAYGKAEDSFQRIADLWNVYFNNRNNDNDTKAGFRKLKGYEVAILMVLFKVAREMNKHKTDNLMDIAGYAALAEDLQN